MSTALSLELSKDKDLLANLDSLWVKFRSAHWLQDGYMAPQLTSSYYLIVVKQAEGLLTLDLETYRLQQDVVYFVSPGQTIGICEDHGKKADVYLMEFDIHQDGQGTVAFPLTGDTTIHMENAMLMLCEQLCSSSRSDKAMERFRGQSLFQELLYWIMNHLRQATRPDSRAAMDRTKLYIDNHYREGITIEQLARMAEISPKYYVNLFKKTYGKTAIDYLTEVRVTMAKQLMVQSDVRLREIAFQVGYNDEFYFSRMFKKEVGVSPTIYLKNRRLRIAAYSAPTLGQLLALKIVPYAAPLHPKWTSYYYNKYRTDIPLHLSGYRYNEDWEVKVEALAQSQLDCIICTDQLHPLEKERLERIAPVHIIPLHETTWREQLLMTAKIVGATDEAEAWLNGYNRKVAHVRDRLHDKLKQEKLLVISQFKDSYHIFPTRGMREVVYGDLQMNVPRGVEGYHEGQGLDLEELVSINADHILLNICQETETLHHWERVQNSKQWQDLEAVRKNKVHFISSDPWREYSAYASERMIIDLNEQLCGNRT
ncbi:HTH-type transcriptional activator Btr [Paenibacillus marchantiophytorum]|uniref:HTH-type transcriptional activator Btr n=1 Tax=Paenibacillus marchantiophytorum TaxID=1619310 RepID=A0ABQ1F3A3_9BACL|nr:AraC family transcriptional regulator [Paenibacillus marchantiophytorum]GFZ98655.1 HTH-type transcriptional activator Btr [Paenibacillus marchantiophytorum]